MTRSLAPVGIFLAALCSGACHRPTIVPVPDCGAEAYGTPGVEFAPANTLDPLSSRAGGEHLVVRVREGTVERRPIVDAGVALFVAGGGPDSGRGVAGRLTAKDGEAALDSLTPGRYEILIRRIGYAPYRQHVTVRSGFVDTVAISLRAVPVCLVE